MKPLLRTNRRFARDTTGTTEQLSFQFEDALEVGNCWQDEWIERFWCAQCEGTSCNEGDVLNIRACKTGVAAQQFTWIPTKGGGRLKVARKDLCLERIGTNEFELRNCSSTLMQVLVGFNQYSPFEINPFGNVGKKCLTQDHHPKPYEVLFTGTCDAARRTNTSLWEAYQQTGKYDPTISPFTKWLSNRNSNCIPSNPCPECTGNCAKDTDYMEHSSVKEDIVKSVGSHSRMHGNGISSMGILLELDSKRSSGCWESETHESAGYWEPRTSSFPVRADSRTHCRMETSRHSHPNMHS
ncbi:Ricin-type beta-trefoil lectin domain [Fragilaria crotonensis]|nr:Ricin-type beta-trefoil lectin domain [Fragilaria crotonensis]